VVALFGLTGFAPQEKVPVGPDKSNPHQSLKAGQVLEQALADLRNGDKGLALGKLDEGLKNHPDDHRLLSLRASIHMMGRAFFKALGDLNKAIELQPGEPKLLVNRSLVHRSFKNYQQAFDDLNKAVELSPELYSAYFNRATLHYGQGKMPEAARDFQKCIELNSTDPKPRHNLALTLDAQGKRDAAIKVLEDLRESIDDRHWRGVAAKQLRDWEEPDQMKNDAEPVPNPHK
jgi:Flp pilus assembly protein TadD